jgi:SAM-dependent methyltransferase
MGNERLADPASRYADPATGGKYFSWQQAAGRKGAIYNLKLFAPYIHEDHDVLDFGCGGGYILEALHCREKVGVEINPVAQIEAMKMGIQTCSTLADLTGRTFDRIISSHCLEHVANPYESLCQMRGLLRQNGRLILLLPVDDWRNEPWVGTDDNGHLYGWTPRLLGNLLTSAGFRPLLVKVVNYNCPPRVDAILWALSRTLFTAIAYTTAVLLRRRQIWALAEPV